MRRNNKISLRCATACTSGRTGAIIFAYTDTHSGSDAITHTVWSIRCFPGNIVLC